MRGKAPDGPVKPRPMLPVPLDAPGFTLNRWSKRAFSEAYFRLAKPSAAVIDDDRCFDPPDAVLIGL